MPPHRSNKSVVWKYFQKSKNGSHPQCRLCLKFVKSTGNTINLKNHLQRKHEKVPLFTNNENSEIINDDASDTDVELSDTEMVNIDIYYIILEYLCNQYQLALIFRQLTVTVKVGSTLSASESSSCVRQPTITETFATVNSYSGKLCMLC